VAIPSQHNGSANPSPLFTAFHDRTMSTAEFECVLRLSDHNVNYNAIIVYPLQISAVLALL
jgi:hypothetical protein